MLGETDVEAKMAHSCRGDLTELDGVDYVKSRVVVGDVGDCNQFRKDASVTC